MELLKFWYRWKCFLGGDDFDNKIIDWLADEFKAENGFDVKMTNGTSKD